MLCGIATGAVAIYFEWNGHLHALAKDAPSLAAPGQILAAMQALYEHGSWSIGRHGTSPVTGFFLGLVWLGEAVLIGGLCLVAAHSMIAEVPYCEKTQCWLDKTKKIETLDAFTKPEHLSAFAAGDLSPLLQAQRRPVGASAFARLTIRHSPRCEEFCTISVANVTITQDRDGDPSESETELVSNLILPKSMMDLVGKFQGFKAPEAAGSEAPAASA